MRDTTLENLLKQERNFLEEIHSTHRFKRLRHLLTFATTDQLHVLVGIIHRVVSGQFALHHTHFRKLLLAKRLPFLRANFEHNEDYKKLLHTSREKLMRKLFFVQSTLPAILESVLD